MTAISIKIVEVHQPSCSVVVKFATENSAKSIDEYDGIAFNVANFNSLTPEQFIESIRPQISQLVTARDASERLVNNLDLSQWEGYSTKIEALELPTVDLASAAQIVPALTNPEVFL